MRLLRFWVLCCAASALSATAGSVKTFPSKVRDVRAYSTYSWVAPGADAPFGQLAVSGVSRTGTLSATGLDSGNIAYVSSQGKGVRYQ
jgi:hypothetical protein